MHFRSISGGSRIFKKYSDAEGSMNELMIRTRREQEQEEQEEEEFHDDAGDLFLPSGDRLLFPSLLRS